MDVLSDDELSVLIGFISSSRDRLMCLLMGDAGLRVGELVNLLVDDLVIAGVPIRALTVRGEISKSGKDRTIPLTPRCIGAINDTKEYVWSRYQVFDVFYAFFVNDPRQHITTRQVERLIHSYAKGCIGRPIHPHVLRHTFATRLMRKTNSRIVQQLLGHTCLTSTQVYEHPNDQDLRDAIKSL